MTKATRTETTFRLEYAVSTTIAAAPEGVWSVLSDLKSWTRWNTTVTSIEGELVRGQKLTLRVPISERTFTPKVAEISPNRGMVWSDGAAPMFKGVRTYTLAPRAGATDFAMHEVFSGLMLPMIKGSLPDFRAPFERFAADLKREVEARV